jgi:hypothetical protein
VDPEDPDPQHWILSFNSYPQEFTDLQKNTNEELTKCCDNFFDLLDNFAETKNKHRHAIWPLQIMLLILTPKVSEWPCLCVCGAKSLVRSMDPNV